MGSIAAASLPRLPGSRAKSLVRAAPMKLCCAISSRDMTISRASRKPSRSPPRLRNLTQSTSQPLAPEFRGTSPTPARYVPVAEGVSRAGYEPAIPLSNLASRSGGYPEQALRYLELSPQDSGRVLFAMGKIHPGAGRWTPARRCFEQGLDLEPDSGDGRDGLGAVDVGEGNLPKALEHFEKALTLRPGMTSALVNAGQAHLAQGQPERAAVSPGGRAPAHAIPRATGAGRHCANWKSEVATRPLRLPPPTPSYRL
jgi:hypothetical protein